MKNIEVTHTLRFYDPKLVAKLDALMKRVQAHYRNKNEFMTVLIKMGYESYIAAEKNAQDGGASEPPVEHDTITDGETDSEITKDIKRLLEELTLYQMTQFRQTQVNLSLFRRMFSVIYNMVFSLAGGKAVPLDKVEDGFFDDLPARFDEIIVRLEGQYGLTG